MSFASSKSAGASPLPSARHPNPLITVMGWELRRLSSARSTWLIPLLIFVLACLIELALSTNTDPQKEFCQVGEERVALSPGVRGTVPTWSFPPARR